MDQLETIAPRMESAGSESSGMRLIAALLNEIDQCARAGASESGVGVVILGTCRNLADLDTRILRSGRLDQVCHPTKPSTPRASPQTACLSPNAIRLDAIGNYQQAFLADAGRRGGHVK